MGGAAASGSAKAGLARMLEARSVAVVGVSVKEGSLGAQMMTELRRGGFPGPVYPVNPGYEEVDGYRCFPSIADVPEPADLAIIGVANARIEQAVADVAAAGVGSIVTFSSLHEEPQDRPSPNSAPLRERVAAICREHGIPLCGGNGMGFMNEEHRLRATGFPTPEGSKLGPVTFISHSGSAFAAFAFNDRQIGFNLLISSGQEIVTTMGEYMEYALGLPSTRVMALLLETVRDADLFVSQLARAAQMEVPVIALKVGRTEGAKAMVTAHSGALAGEHGAYEALFDAQGVHEVRSLDELAETIELFACPRRVVSGSGVASVHDSGGERALFVDQAQDEGTPIAKVSEETLRRIQDTLDPGLDAANPLDAWGTGIDADRIFRDSFAAFSDDPEVAAMVFVVDLTRQGEPYDEGYLQIALDVFASTTKPFCMLSNLPAAIAPEEVRLLRDAGIPVLEGTGSGLRALRHLLDDRDFRSRPSVEAVAVAPDVRDRWRARLSVGSDVGELEGLALFTDYGIPTVQAEGASTLEEALAAAGEVGYPVALKTAAPGVHHKSDVGGVRLGISNGEELTEAYRDLAGRLGPQVVVAQMAPEGVEVALGVVTDPQFGPLVLVAAGGILVELLKDRRLGMPPLDESRARRLVDGLKIRPILDGVRGAPAADIEALARAVSALSALAADLGDLLDALDANPVIVSPSGCLAVDALVLPRG